MAHVQSRIGWAELWRYLLRMAHEQNCIATGYASTLWRNSALTGGTCPTILLDQIARDQPQTLDVGLILWPDQSIKSIFLSEHNCGKICSIL